jgi:RNA polymerase sigma factor (sigma-70 family)
VTDEALMRAVRDGEVARLGTLFERHHAALFDFLARMTGSRTVADDLTQDVFVRMLKYRATFRDEGRFETWMFRIARNARADYFRTRDQARFCAVELLEAESDTPGPASQFERGRDEARLRQALLKLRDDRRELIVLARYREMKYDAIAELLGIDPGTVKVRVHRAMKELREIFMQLTEKQSCDVQTPPRTLRTI